MSCNLCLTKCHGWCVTESRITKTLTADWVTIELYRETKHSSPLTLTLTPTALTLLELIAHVGTKLAPWSYVTIGYNHATPIWPRHLHCNPNCHSQECTLAFPIRQDTHIDTHQQVNGWPRVAALSPPGLLHCNCDHYENLKTTSKWRWYTRPGSRFNHIRYIIATRYYAYWTWIF